MIIDIPKFFNPALGDKNAPQHGVNKICPKKEWRD
jgi:hypothetical protein